jgi:hypothetical protein
MRLSEMTRTVSEDLLHIPKGSRGGPQQLLRAFYPMDRRHDLKEDASTPRANSLAKAIASVRDHADPNFKPEFDSEYFR